MDGSTSPTTSTNDADCMAEDYANPPIPLSTQTSLSFDLNLFRRASEAKSFGFSRMKEEGRLDSARLLSIA